MTITIGRKTLITLLILALLAVSGFIAYRMMFSGTNAAVRHAEAFLFRRMTVAALAGEGSYRFFYSTNRAPGEGSPDGIDVFSRERGGALSFGQFDTDVQPSLGLGMLINPTEWFQNEEIRITDSQRLPDEAFIEGLRAQVEESPHRGLLVVVHGFRERFPSALRKTVFVGHVLDHDRPLIAGERQ